MSLCTRTKQTQASVLQASQIPPQLGFTPSPRPPTLLHLGAAQWSRHTWHHCEALSALCTSLFPLPLSFSAPPTREPSPFPPKREHCRLSRAPSHSAQRSLDVSQKHDFSPLGPCFTSRSQSCSSGIRTSFLPTTSGPSSQAFWAPLQSQILIFSLKC